MTIFIGILPLSSAKCKFWKLFLPICKKPVFKNVSRLNHSPLMNNTDKKIKHVRQLLALIRKFTIKISFLLLFYIIP